MITQSSIDKLKDRIDIVEVVGWYTQLKKNGANFKACCPFHNEDTPSFVVSPAKQIYHCFGCGVGGDAIAFVMNHEHVDYGEALEIIAQKSNFTLEYARGQERAVDYGVMQRMNAYFLSHRSDEVKHYLTYRGLSKQSIEEWEIGFAPTSMQTMKFIDSSFLDKQSLLDFGVIGQKEGRTFCYWQNRIMLPIYSNNDKIVGFNGRIIDKGEPKYLNSPQTKFFNKSVILFGLHKARKAINDAKKIIVTEGCFDVIAFHQIDIKYTVATLGTALGEGHLPKLKQFGAYIVLAYDGDKAGITAAFKAAVLLSHAGLDGGVVLFPSGKDPADMVRDGEIATIHKLLETPTSFIPYVLDTIVRRYDISDPVKKEQALKECHEYMKGLTPLLRDEYALYLAKVLRIDALHVKQKQPPKAPQKSNTEDLGELAVLKAAVLKEGNINTMLEIVDVSCFKKHSDLFQHVLNDNEDVAQILACRCDIPELDEEGLKKQLLTLAQRRYFEYLAELHASTSIPHKIKKINEVARRLKQLKEGHLVHWGKV